LACLLVLGVFSGFIVCSKHTVFLINKSSKTWYTSFESNKNLGELTPGQQVWTRGCMITLPKNNSKKVANRAKIIIADDKLEAQSTCKTYVIDYEIPHMQTQTITAVIQEDGTLTTNEGYTPVLLSAQESAKSAQA
jgi:hypothetical protein